MTTLSHSKYIKSTKGTCPHGHVDEYTVTKNNNRYCVPCARIKSRGYLAARKDRRTYEAWLAMKRRCDNPNAQNYYLYGGRGIKYTPAWAEYKNFLADMGEKPTDEYSLERKDYNGEYSKENCKWADKWEQANNKRDTLFIEYKGETKPLAVWCRELNLKPATIWNRLYTLKWSVEDAFTIKAVKGNNQNLRGSNG